MKKNKSSGYFEGETREESEEKRKEEEKRQARALEGASLHVN